MDKQTTITRHEWFWVVLASTLVVIAAALPFVIGYLAQTESLVFQGMLPTLRPDNYTYLAKMWQGYRGSWQYELVFTPEPHQGIYVMIFYLALGHLARLMQLDLMLVFHAARLFCGFLMLLLIYRFIAQFAEGSVRTRQVAFLLAVTASGLGWLTESIAPTQPTGISPIDFWLLDGYIYLSLLAAPHFCVAIGLMLIIFIILLNINKDYNIYKFALLILTSLALAVILPHMLLFADGLPLLYWGIEWLRTRDLPIQGVRTVIIMGFMQLPFVVYELWALHQPVFAELMGQDLTLSPPPQSYLWGYGLLLILAIIGVIVSVRRVPNRLAFPLLWIGLVAIVIYLPVNFQRRFLTGVQVPLGLFAGVGLADGLLRQPTDQKRHKSVNLLLLLVISIASMTNLYLTVGYTIAAASHAPSLFWPTDVVVAVDWLGQHTTFNDTTLASLEIGNLIPARTGNRVVLGHWAETIDYKNKLAEVATFFTATTPDIVRIELLQKYGVVYVLHGPYERLLGDFDPSSADYLTAVFQQGDVTVYKVSIKE